MKSKVSAGGGRWWASSAALALGLGAAACDDDPARPDQTFPTPSVLTDSVIERQEAIRVLFAGGLLAQTALDPANFVVVNQCNGLRIEGSLRLGGDTLVFTPSQALPYLTNIGVRVQNLLAANGAQQQNPITLQFTTQPPPVSDASWQLVNSPTNDALTGVDFGDPNVGFTLASGGALYRTSDAGTTFSPAFKNDDISGTGGLHAFGRDTVYFVGGVRTGTTFGSALFLSTNSGQTFAAVGPPVTPSIFTARLVRAPGGSVIRGVLGAQLNVPVAYTYNSSVGAPVPASGLSGSTSVALGDVALSADTIHALVAEGNFVNGAGVAHRSVDGGRTYTPITLPANTYQLRGTGFVNATTGFLLGDSSAVIRVNAATGATAALGASAGIPQTVRVAATNDVTSYTFLRARFDASGTVGYIVGFSQRSRPGQADVVTGIILTSRDGGQSFQRQAIAGTPDNGLGFSPALDVRIQPSGRSFLSGVNGLLARRESDAPTSVAACSFTQP